MSRKKLNVHIPPYYEFMIPILKALIELGGSGKIEEINDKVYSIANVKDEILEIQHNEKSNDSEIDYRLAWARTYLKAYGLITNSSRGVWALVNSNIDPDKIIPQEIVEFVREKLKTKSPKKSEEKVIEEAIEVDEDEFDDWKNNLLSILQNILPASFERLVQRILREYGFTQVEVTGKTGDGGIDGKGIIRISGLISFHVIFQCKRYKGSISPSQIRDFRGAMQGRADKGIFITTGNFTRDAIKEATRDGAPPIDLIDGDLLCNILKELKLCIESEMVENVILKEDWFKNF
jgi:restriction system protein